MPFSEWGGIADARLVGAVIDRLTFNAHVIETGTESYPYQRPIRGSTGDAAAEISAHPSTNSS